MVSIVRARTSVLRVVVAATLASLTAACGGGGDPVAVTPPVCSVTAVSVSPATAALLVGATSQLTATPTSTNCSPVPTATWSSSAAGVASVNSSGLVTAVAAGTATITATVGSAAGTMVVTVSQAPVASVALSTTTPLIGLSGTAQVTALLKDAGNNTLTGRTVAWSSSATTVATVNSAGLVTATGVGTTTITALAEGITGTLAVTVVPALESDRYASIWADQLNIAVGTSYPALGLYSVNAAGGTNSVLRQSDGSYLVTLGRMAKGTNAANRETFLVTAYGSNGEYCRIGGWGDINTIDIQVSVFCYSLSGAPANSAFNLAMIGSNTLTGKYAFMWASTGTASVAASSAYAFTTGTEPPASTYQSAGAYRMSAGFSTTNFVISMVSSYGDAKRCNLGFNTLSVVSGASLDVRCTTLPTNLASDSRWTALLAEGGRAGKRWGFVETSQASSAIGATVTPSWAKQSNDQLPTVTRDATGLYTVRLTGLGTSLFGGTMLATSFTAGASGIGPCQVTGWTSANNDVVVGVRCWSLTTGQPADQLFALFAIE